MQNSEFRVKEDFPYGKSNLLEYIRILEKRKKGDTTKNRNHFEDNIKYLNKEIKFYKLRVQSRIVNFQK